MRLLSLQCAAVILIFLQSLSAAPLTPGNLLLAHLDYPPSGDFAFSEVVVLEEMTADGESVQTWPLGCTRTAMMSATMTWSDDRTMVSISCYDGVDGQAPTGYETNEVHTLHQDGTITVTSITNPFAKSFTKDATYPFVLADTTVVSGTDLWIVGEVYKSSTFGDTSLFFGYTTFGSTGSATYSSANGPALTLLGVQYLEANYHLLYREQTKIMAIDSMPKSTTFPTLTTVVSATTYPSSIWADSLTNVYSIDPLTRLYKDTSGTFQTYQAQSNFMDRDDAVTGLDIFGVKTLFTRMGNSIYTRNDTGTGFTAKTLMHTFGELSRVIDMKAIPAPDSCTDLKMNQNETDVDCGGICGASCADTQLCSSDDDCLNNYCTSDGECATPTCLDSVQNQNETDTDCGGVCDGCLEGKNCLLDSDCETNACENGICISTCFDGLLNQNETDVDCGAVCGATCFVGKNCFENSDCETDACVEGICIPKCLDGLLNQNETDVDCGGVCGNTCSEGENCLEHSDCTSNYCSNSVCSVEPVPQVVPLASTGAPDSSPEANELAPQETNPPQSTQVPQGPRTPRSRISVNSATHLAGNVLLMTIVCFFV